MLCNYITDLQANHCGSDFLAVFIFKKLCDTNTNGDIDMTQWGTDCGILAYLCILETVEENSKGLEKVANIVCSKMNEYEKRE